MERESSSVQEYPKSLIQGVDNVACHRKVSLAQVSPRHMGLGVQFPALCNSKDEPELGGEGSLTPVEGSRAGRRNRQRRRPVVRLVRTRRRQRSLYSVSGGTRVRHDAMRDAWRQVLSFADKIDQDTAEVATLREARAHRRVRGGRRTHDRARPHGHLRTRDLTVESAVLTHHVRTRSLGTTPQPKSSSL